MIKSRTHFGGLSPDDLAARTSLEHRFPLTVLVLVHWDGVMEVGLGKWRGMTLAVLVEAVHRFGVGLCRFSQEWQREFTDDMNSLCQRLKGEASCPLEDVFLLAVLPDYRTVLGHAGASADPVPDLGAYLLTLWEELGRARN